MSDATTQDDDNLELARESLRDLLYDQRVPDDVRSALHEDYRQVEQLLDKLENNHLHIAVFGRVSVGKSALINAMLGEQRFSTSPLHGETKEVQQGLWQAHADGSVYIIDTPGINEVDGETREQLAHNVAANSDMVLFVVDGDLTDTEYEALHRLGQTQRPILLVLNKIDRYNEQDRAVLVESLTRHTHAMIAPENIITCVAAPREQIVIRVDAAGNETQHLRTPPPQIEHLKNRIWSVLEKEGKTLAALNATLFAGRLSDQIAQNVLAARHHLGEKVIRTWCVAKGVAVALNPIPVADLVAAAAVDASLLVHLSKVYGLPISRSEAHKLVKTIGTQMLLLVGTVWAVHLVSSALKIGTGGLSALATAGAQGAVAYYSTYVVGRAAERYLANGKSWGEGGPKVVVQEILDNLDRSSILAQAKKDIAARIRSSA